MESIIWVISFRDKRIRSGSVQYSYNVCHFRYQLGFVTVKRARPLARGQIPLLSRTTTKLSTKIPQTPHTGNIIRLLIKYTA